MDKVDTVPVVPYPEEQLAFWFVICAVAAYVPDGAVPVRYRIYGTVPRKMGSEKLRSFFPSLFFDFFNFFLIFYSHNIMFIFTRWIFI